MSLKVAIYSRLARGALDAYTGPVDAEVAKAWAILAYLYGYMGDTAEFEEYLELADAFLTASIEQGSTDMLPAGFAEMIHYKQTVRMQSGNVDATHIESWGARRQHPPQVLSQRVEGNGRAVWSCIITRSALLPLLDTIQINPAASERDLYVYVARSIVAFDQMAFEKACKDSAACEQSSDHEPCLENRGGVTPQGNPPQTEEVSDAMVAGLNDGLFDFGQLQEAVDRPNIRTGVGGLIINMCHLAHGILGALATIDDSRAQGLYNRLQGVYNRFRPHAYLPAPPLEKWRGISAFCDHFQCRVNEGIIASQGMSAFSTPPVCASNYAGSQTKCKQGGSHIAVEEHHDNMVLAGVIPENATGAMMAAPCSNGDRPMASTSSWELLQDPAPRTDPPAGPSFSSSQVNCEPARAGRSDSDVSNSAVEGCGGGAVSGWVAHVPDMSLRSPELREVDGGAEETWNDKIPAADWLDVTHAMLGAIDDDGPAL
ncbi:expressed unknown protein [Ectocarpus siliculosus]|uniref:Uncharacterized protein n=1 Tax=Ectocarpus siliculosus TaxID=2880 RepID=D8LU26_ECTSI|nr:expressed unknown protein [Ectocarpus siliculosus]|eukprot:CBN75416.1 expressed unknown protein [Ectocarpus siliculosus]